MRDMIGTNIENCEEQDIQRLTVVDGKLLAKVCSHRCPFSKNVQGRIVLLKSPKYFGLLVTISRD
jgi:hypothetical protein